MTECPRRPSARYQSALNESFTSRRGVAQPHGAHKPLLEVTHEAGANEWHNRRLMVNNLFGGSERMMEHIVALTTCFISPFNTVFSGMLHLALVFPFSESMCLLTHYTRHRSLIWSWVPILRLFSSDPYRQKPLLEVVGKDWSEWAPEQNHWILNSGVSGEMEMADMVCVAGWWAVSSGWCFQWMM